MLLKVLLLMLTLWFGCEAKPHLLATAPIGYATGVGGWYPTAGAAYYPAYAAYTYTPVYYNSYNSYATYPYYTYPYLRR